MRKKAILFIDKVMTASDFEAQQKLKDEGYLTTVADGNFKKGFEDSCDAVCLQKDFPHVQAWAESKGISVISFEEKKEPVKQEAKQETVENVEEPKPATRRTRKAKTEEVSE